MANRADSPVRVLVTGAAGFIGRYVVSSIRNRWQSADIIALDRNLGNDIGIDLCDAVRLREFIDSKNFTHVVHASGGHAHYSETQQLEMHVLATQFLVDALTSNGRRVRLVNIGSSSQYGRQDPEHTPLLSEDQPDRPLSPYAKSKSRQEQIIIKAAESGLLEPVYLRLFNPVGIGQQEPFIVPNLLKQILESDDTPVRFRITNPHSARDFLDVRDTAEAIVAAMEAPMAVGQKMNVCSGHATKLADLAKLLSRIAGRPCSIDGRDFVETLIPFQRGNRRKIHDLCGWEPHYSLQDSLTDIWETIGDG